MSGEALYERYKEALRRGHVASLRGRLEDALAAYGEAASIAPERATPHTSAGTALLRRKRAADALRYYASALAIAPRDEAALLGRAQALAALDRRPEAADGFDTLAEVRAASGKLADAVDAARRGLEMAEGRDRRRTLERLIARLRASEPGEPGRVALERALLILEGPAVTEGPAASRAGAAPAVEAAAVAGDEAPPHAADAAPGLPAELSEAAEPAEPAEPGEPVAWAEPAEPDAPKVRRALDRDLPPDADAASLAVRAEEALDAGVLAQTLEALLDLAAAYRRDGYTDGALDACYLALSIDPDDVGLHLALIELYDERGWTALAGDKVDLLAALARLDGDAAVEARIDAARAARA
jgi:tetratricopeptide (TPR) repeat protein